MDITTMRIASTLAALACFLGIWFWAWRGSNRERFEEAALVPFAENESD